MPQTQARTVKPKWSLYDITANNVEHDLFENAIVEFTDIAGIEITYHIRDETISMDSLYGETTNVAYTNSFDTKLIYELTEEVTMTTGFGIVSEDLVQFGFMPIFIWKRDVSTVYDPKPGDVVQTLWNNRNYEVVDVGLEAHIFQLDKRIYEFILKPYRFSEQSDTAKAILKSPDSTLSDPISAYGENTEIEEMSNDIFDYEAEDIDSSVYGF